METTKEVIRETLTLYEKYCKVLDLLEPDKLPVLTLNESEFKTVLPHYKTKMKLSKVLGYCVMKHANYNNVIYINIPIMKYIKGLHDWTPIEIVKKRKNTYEVKYKIPHLEETLIHELVHAKYGHKLRHGKKFNQIVRNIYLSNNHIT
jgi:hypothetical protein